jgi:hypothetical protein
VVCGLSKHAVSSAGKSLSFSHAHALQDTFNPLVSSHLKPSNSDGRALGFAPASSSMDNDEDEYAPGSASTIVMTKQQGLMFPRLRDSPM